MREKGLYEIFIDELNLLHDVETKIIKSLPEIINAANDRNLKEAFKNHLKETKEQLRKLNEIWKNLGENLVARKCEAIEGLIKDANKAVNASYSPNVKDAALISAAQKIEHYEIAAYGSLRAFAKHLGLDEIAKKLEENEKEEAHADKILTKIAEGRFYQKGVNDKACEE